ncbi:CLUMA_CG014271, isoform A, partial [Clunio marinus]
MFKTAMKFLFELLLKTFVILFIVFGLFISCVNGESISRANNCIQCDSANENERNCGNIKDSYEVSVQLCDPILGCFTEIYQ